jgi:hypothetical protein
MLEDARDASTWPYVAAGWAVMASVFPWIVGGFLREEFGLRASALLGIFFALPVGYSAMLLADSPYETIALAFWALVAWWGVHACVSLVLTAMRKHA